VRESYIEQKVIDLFHVKYKNKADKLNSERIVAAIVNNMHNEIHKIINDLETKLLGIIEATLRENL
jgi:hypothetical protein